MGRPTDFTPELGVKICEAIASIPYSLKRICALNPGFPVDSTVVLWTNKYPDFSSQYLEAKRRQIYARVEYATQLLEEADVTTKAGVAKALAQVNLIKWEASRLLPKLYGDKTFEDEKPFSDSEKAGLQILINQFLAKHEREY